MTEELKTRADLGLLLRGFREKKGWSRKRLAKETGLRKRTINCLEHGVVNPTRRDFRNVMNALDLPADKKEVASRLLLIVHPFRRRVKFHLPFYVLRHRNRHRRQ